MNQRLSSIRHSAHRRPKPQPQPKSETRRSSQHHPASIPLPAIPASLSIHTSSPSSSPPPSLTGVNSVTGLPLTSLPACAPARTGIVVPPRVLSHLQRHPVIQTTAHRKNATASNAAGFLLLCSRNGRAQSPLKDFSGNRGLFYPSGDSVAFATTSDLGPSLQHSNLNLDLDVYGLHGLVCVCGRGNRR